MTPGPWVWTGPYPVDDYEYNAPPVYTPIDVATFRSTGYGGNPVLRGAGNVVVLDAGGGEYTPYHGATPDEAIANALAIAALPELIAALRDIASMPEQRGTFGAAAVQAARAALAKVKP